jgi:hypothetical protein
MGEQRGNLLLKVDVRKFKLLFSGQQAHNNEESARANLKRRGLWEEGVGLSEVPPDFLFPAVGTCTTRRLS